MPTPTISGIGMERECKKSLSMQVTPVRTGMDRKVPVVARIVIMMLLIRHIACPINLSQSR